MREHCLGEKIFVEVASCTMSLSFEEIKSIAKQITAVNDRKQYNSIIKLINELSIKDQSVVEDESNERRLRFIVMSLFQIFKKLFARGDLSLRSMSKKAEVQQFGQWCRKIYESFKTKLLTIISDLTFENSLGLDSLDVYLQMLELESIYFASKKDTPYFPNKTLRKLIIALWMSKLQTGEQDESTGQSRNPIIVEFAEKYYKKYADIQFYFQSEFNLLLEESAQAYTTVGGIGKWLTVVNHDNHCSTVGADLEAFVSNPPQAVENDSKYKSNLEKNWLLLLNGELSLEQYKTVLLILHKRIIVHFHSPTKLMDFLTDSYNLQSSDANAGGVVPILALNGLFELMLRYNLEYPNFFIKLYQLITPNLMHVKYRARFFRLMDTFLSSTHLSAHLVASFIKRLARLTLESSPAAIVSVIPFVYNLLKKHPSCMIMLHNPGYVSTPFMTSEESEGLKKLKSEYVDPFDPLESNPESTKALDSSLWELATLMEHYHPNVATLAKIFGQPFRKMNYNMEDFLDWSYESLLAAETSRRLKILPTLEFDTFDKFFSSNVDDQNSFLNGVDW